MMKDDNMETPKKPSKRTTKKEVSKDPISKRPKEKLLNFDSEELYAYFKDVINDVSKDQERILKQQQERVDVEERVYHLLSEYLSGFVLIGYNAYNNERIILKAAANEQEDDSLYELLKLSFIQIMQSRAIDNGGLGLFEPQD
jgi:hypothetical protein